MALHLITGYAGQEHVTSADQGAYNMGTYGEGEFVLDRGNKLAATVASNNSITIADGEALMQGRFIKLPVGTTESVTIDNGTSGMKRKDLIVLRYSKNAGTGVESVEFAVKKGTPDASTPADPSVTTGNITDGTDLVNEMKLYRVNLDGLNISSLDTLFSLKTSMIDYMETYQLPVATASILGGVKKGDRIDIANDGTLSVPLASANAFGVVKKGDNLNINGGVLSVPNATTSSRGVVSVGSGLSVNNGSLSLNLPTAASNVLGGIKVGNGLQISSGILSVKPGTNITVDSGGVKGYKASKGAKWVQLLQTKTISASAAGFNLEGSWQNYLTIPDNQMYIGWRGYYDSSLTAAFGFFIIQDSNNIMSVSFNNTGSSIQINKIYVSYINLY